MLKRLERWLPHATILICNMYLVFFLIDRVNPAMNFIDNALTKGLLLLLCAAALFNARRSLSTMMKRRGQAATTARPAGVQPRPLKREPRSRPSSVRQSAAQPAKKPFADGQTEPRWERR